MNAAHGFPASSAVSSAGPFGAVEDAGDSVLLRSVEAASHLYDLAEIAFGAQLDGVADGFLARAQAHLDGLA